MSQAPGCWKHFCLVCCLSKVPWGFRCLRRVSSHSQVPTVMANRLQTLGQLSSELEAKTWRVPSRWRVDGTKWPKKMRNGNCQNSKKNLAEY